MRERKDKSAERRVPPVHIEDRAGVSSKRTLSERSIHSGVSRRPTRQINGLDQKIPKWAASRPTAYATHPTNSHCCSHRSWTEAKGYSRVRPIGARERAASRASGTNRGQRRCPCLRFRSNLQNRNGESYQTSTPADDNTQATSRPDFRSKS